MKKTDSKGFRLKRKFVWCQISRRIVTRILFGICQEEWLCSGDRLFLPLVILNWSYGAAPLLRKQRFGSFARSPAQSVNEEKYCLSGGNTEQVLCMCTYTHPLSPSLSVILLIRVGRDCLIPFCANMCNNTISLLER